VIKLLIKQGPFYISSFTALFLAMVQTGFIKPDDGMNEIALPGPMIGSAVECNADGECTESFMLGDLDFAPEVAFYQEWWFVLAVLVIGGLALGWLASRVWSFLRG